MLLQLNRRHGKLTSLDSLLPQVAKIMGIESRMKELMIMNYWPEIAKGEIGKDSKPYSITKGKKGLTLNIATKSSMVTQELSLVKMALLDKVNRLSMQIGLQVNDIVFSTKYWEEREESSLTGYTLEEKKKSSYFDIEKIRKIELTEGQKRQIDIALSDIRLEKEDKERLKKRLELELRIDKYKEQLGHPYCKACGVVLNNPLAEYCPVCKFQ